MREGTREHEREEQKKEASEKERGERENTTQTGEHGKRAKRGETEMRFSLCPKTSIFWRPHGASVCAQISKGVEQESWLVHTKQGVATEREGEKFC